MADKKLFEDLVLGTPTDTDRFAFGKASSSYKNITLEDFKTVLFGGSGGPLKQVVLEIGSWNMNDISGGGSNTVRIESSTGVDVLFSNVRGVASILIYNDAQDNMWEFMSDDTGNAPSIAQPNVMVQRISGAAALVYMNPRVGSIFQSSSVFSNTGVNRGWIVINYV